MALCMPINLSGNTLGERHRYLNQLVRDASISVPSLDPIASLPEISPIDRLFKIDLAIQQKNVNYIIQNLKNDDMLYVSRALKAKWLINEKEIINPKYLEDSLYPEMIVPAISKVKHWLYINLRDDKIAEDFYKYYEDSNFNYAIKFLSICSPDFIEKEFPTIGSKISPHYLKVLSEKCPKVAKIFFDSLATNDDVMKIYLNQSFEYYKSIKCVLKSEPDVFLDITEKHYQIYVFRTFNEASTDFIMTKHKERFTAKSELYAACILHLPTVAKRLTEDECEELIIKLAKASYLNKRFDYKAVEPLVKRLAPQKRTAIKKRVFIDKDFGEVIKTWPYEPPVGPMPTDKGDIFKDEILRPFTIQPQMFNKRCLKKRKFAKYECDEMMMCEMSCRSAAFPQSMSMCRMKTELDRLFDEFRFKGFDQSMHELRNRLGAAGTPDRRRDIMLVLVSKSAGRMDHVDTLLRLTEQHVNEPAHTRAAVVRSLVKRANVWRLPEESWQRLLNFSRGLGLDGAKPEAECLEGLHAVVIRQLLANGHCEPGICKAFLDNFSTLNDYSLNGKEKAKVSDALQLLLATSAIDNEPDEAIKNLERFLDVLQAYSVRKTNPEIVEAIKTIAKRDWDASKHIIDRLFDMRIARKELLQENLKLKRNNAALINALHHEPTAINVTDLVEWLESTKDNYDQFINKLVIYFSEKNNIAGQLKTALKDKVSKEPVVILARPLASLLGPDLESELRKIDPTNGNYKKWAAALRSNIHRARPTPDVISWGYKFAGVKAIATRLFRSRAKEVNSQVLGLASDKRTSRLALQLCKRAPSTVIEAFTIASSKRPSSTLRGALLYMKSNGKSSKEVWNIIKPLILNIDLKIPQRIHLQSLLSKTDYVPMEIRPYHCAMLYSAFEKVSNSYTVDILQDIMKYLPKVDPALVENILTHMLTVYKNKKSEKDTADNESKEIDIDDNTMPEILYPALFIRFLLLSPSEDEKNRRFEKIGQPLLERLNKVKNDGSDMFVDFEQDILNQTIGGLKYNEAFLNPKYVSCLPVMEKIKDWLQTIFTKEDNFTQFVMIHLTMLYYKSIRQCVEQKPEFFKDLKKKNTDGIEAVGYTFGRYIGKELSELVSQYFDSIIEIYTEGLNNFLSEFAYYYGVKTKFLSKVLEGFLAESIGMQKRLASHVIIKFRYNIDDSDVEEIKKKMKEDKQIMMFMDSMSEF